MEPPQQEPSRPEPSRSEPSRPGLRVRRAEPADADAIARVQTEGWQHGYVDLLPADFLADLSLTAARRRWRSQLAHADRTTEEFVAVVSGAAEAATTAVGPAEIEAPGVGMTTGAAGRVCGIVVVGPSADPDAPGDGSVGELFAIYVDADRWGAGVGYALHRRAIAALAGRGFGQATLWMLRGNVRAGAFYARQGWRDDHLQKTDEQRVVTLVEVRLRRPLTADDLDLPGAVGGDPDPAQA